MYLAPLTLVLAASATAAAPPTPPVDVVLTRFLDMGGVRAGGGGGGERLIREATSSRMSLKWGQMITGGLEEVGYKVGPDAKLGLNHSFYNFPEMTVSTLKLMHGCIDL